MRGQRKNLRKAVQRFENQKRKIDIFGNYEANGVEKKQRKFENFSTLIPKKSSLLSRVRLRYPNRLQGRSYILPVMESIGISPSADAKCLVEATSRVLISASVVYSLVQ